MEVSMGYFDDADKMICGKCYHHRKSYDEWICNNPESECYMCATEYSDRCDDFEDRANSGFSVSLKRKKKKNNALLLKVKGV